jgi:uncharacterized protein (TIGR02145 family)
MTRYFCSKLRLKQYKFMKIILFLIIISTPLFGQKVSNVNYKQEQNNIIVTYSLDTKAPCTVSLFVSTNGGNSWQGPLIKVLGDVGSNLQSGNKSIKWNVLEEFDELRGENIIFQVQADDNIETILLGNHELSKKNLNVSKYRNGDIIPEVKDGNEWRELKTGAWCYYNNDPKNEAIYGKLYNWYAINDPRGLAPKGYHIPSENEFYEIMDYIIGRYPRRTFITIDEFVETLFLSFKASKGGNRSGRDFYSIENQDLFWTITEGKIDAYGEETAIGLKFHRKPELLAPYQKFVKVQEYSKEMGCSVRLIKDK